MNELKEMTPVRRGEIFDHVRKSMETAVRQGVHSYLSLGKDWSYLVESKAWKYWGSHVKNKADLARDLNLGISVGMLDHQKRVFDTFGKYLKGRTPPLSNLIKLLPLVEGLEGQAMETWVQKANEMPPIMFENEIRDAHGLATSDSECDCINLKVITVCRRCGRRTVTEDKK